MKKFKGNRDLADIKARVLAAGGTWDQNGYDNGDDWINFTYGARRVLYNAFNGKFLVRESMGRMISSDDKLDAVKWFSDLLDLCYIPYDEPKTDAIKTTSSRWKPERPELDDFDRAVAEQAQKIKEQRRLKARKTRLRNGTAKCGGTLAAKLDYLKGKGKS